MLRMIEQYVGPERFRDGVRRYLRAHQFSNTDTSDLWQAIGEATSDASVLPMMDSWVFQGGVPVVEVSQHDDTAVLSQRRFLLLDDGGAAEPPWVIPIHIRFLNETSADSPSPAGLVLGAQPVRLPAPAAGSGSLVANAGGRGYYRTRYDAACFGGLLASFSRLDGREQLTLASDTWALALAGTAQLEDFLSLTAALDENCEPGVWDVVHDAVLLLDRTVPEADRPALRLWCGSLMAPVLERLGWRAVPGESPRQATARSVLIRDLGMIAQDTAVIERARASAVRALSGRAADPGTRGAILAVVASAGGPAEFEQFLASYLRPHSPQDRRRNLDALIELREPALVAAVLSMCLSGMRGEDVADVLRRMLGTRHGGTAAWHFLRDNWNTLIPAQPEKSVWRIVTGVSWLLEVGDDGSATDAEDAGSFIAAHPLGGLHQLADQSLELLEARLAFVRRERGRVGHLLSRSSGIQ